MVAAEVEEEPAELDGAVKRFSSLEIVDNVDNDNELNWIETYERPRGTADSGCETIYRL